MSVDLLGFVTLLPNFLERLLHAAACCTSSSPSYPSSSPSSFSSAVLIQGFLQGIHTGRHSGCTLAGGCYQRRECTACGRISHRSCVRLLSHAQAGCSSCSSTTQAVRLQVDATIAKSVQRVTGSVIGAVYAFLVMLRPVVATNPYAVATMVCFSAFMCGLLVEHRFRYGSFLALYTSAVVMLAQVWVRQGGGLGCCCSSYCMTRV